jgi:hypothetical protein
VSRCADGGSVCEPLAVSASGTVDVGDPAPGTVFEATYEQGGAVVATQRSTAWQGRVTLTQAPSLQGEAVVGGTVSLTPATWSGGWAAPWQSGTFELIAACANANGTGCTVISYGSRPVKLDVAWAGSYLFAYSTRSSATTLPLAQLAAPPFKATLTLGATQVLSAALGPVLAAPSASIRAHALRRNGRLSVARVTCPVRCKVSLTVSSAGRKALHRSLTVTGMKALTIPRRHGKLTVRVVIDGQAVASGKSRAS